MGYIIGNAISICKTFIAGVSKATILAMDGLVAFIFDSAEGVSDTYVGDAKGDDRSSGREIQPGRCYNFDGVDDYVDIGSVYSFTGEFVIEFRFKVGTVSPSIAGVFGNNISNSLFSISTGGLFFRVNGVQLSTGITVSSGNWYKIRIVRDENDLITVFQDDTEKNNATSSGDLELRYIGSYTTSGANFDMHLEYFKASDEGVQKFFYKCEESAGTIAYDSSGNANHGTITNATLSTFHATDTGVVKSYSNDVGYSDGVNYLNQSNNLDSSEWTKRKVVQTSGHSDPFGGNDAWLITEDTSSGYHDIYNQLDGITATSIKTSSVYLKANGRTFVMIIFSTTSNSVVFDLGTCTVSSENGTTTGTITDVGNGWCRCTITDTVQSIDYFQVLMQSDSSTFNYTGDGSSGMYVYGGQCEEGSEATTAQSTFGYSAGAIIPRDESDTANDIFGNVLDYSNRVKYDFDLKSSNCLTFDGVDDYVICGNLGSVTEVSFYVQSVVDNQEIMTLDGANSGRIYVTGDVLSFGGSLTSTAITVDGVSKTASEAGVLINDNEWHLVVCAVSSFTADDVQLGRDASNYGNIRLANVKFNSGALAEYPLAEGAGSTVYDISGNDNHGTMTNFTLSNAWGTTQNVYHYNIREGHSQYAECIQGTNEITLGSSLDFTTIVFEAFSISSDSNQGFSLALTGNHYIMLSGPTGFFSGGASLFNPGRSDFGSGVLFSNDTARFYIIQRNGDNTVSIYEDNNLIGTSSSTTTENLSKFFFGLSSGSGANIRNFRGYNKILSSSERASIQNGERLTDGLELEYLGTGLTPWNDLVGSNNATASGQAVIRIPKKSSSDDAVSGGLNNPAGAFHNNAETKYAAPECPALRVADDAKTTARLYSGANSVELGYDDFEEDFDDEGYYFSDISTDNERKNLLIFDEEKTGSDLTDIQTFLNH